MLLVPTAIPRLTAAHEPIEFRVWDQFTGPDSEVVDQLYATFMEQHPGVTVVREVVDFQPMQQTINTALASGTGPDAVYYGTGPAYAGVLADAGLIIPLEDMAEQYGWDDRVAAGAREQAEIDGELYALPLEVDLIAMYVNKDIMDENGWETPETVADLIAFCGTASEAGYIPIAFANNPGWEAFLQFTYTSNNMIGPDAMRALLIDNEGSWDTPEQVAAIKTFFVDMRDAGCFADDVNAIAHEDGNDLFFNGEAVLHSTGSWLMPQIVEFMPDANRVQRAMRRSFPATRDVMRSEDHGRNH